MVPVWTEVDLDAVTGRLRLVAFDLDNTLASSRQPMETPMADRFSRLTARVDTAVVTGGSYALAVSQVLDVLTPEARRERLTVMPTAGSRCYRWRDGAWRLVYSRDLSDAQRRRISAALERCARDLGLWLDGVKGERIEDRGSQMTLSVLGQLADVEDKRRFDPTGVRMRALADAVQTALPDMLVRTGGYTSVDVSVPGADKAFAMRQLAGMSGIGVDRILFVGDRMEPGGNDYPAVRAGAMGVRVGNPADTLRLLDALLDRLPAGTVGAWER